MKIRVYNGFGSSKKGAPILIKALQDHLEAEVSGIDEREILYEEQWQEETTYLFFSGLSVTKFKEVLKKDGMDKITRGVHEGRFNYVGICAGACFASEEIYYNVRNPDLESSRWISNTGLSFFNGIARGPIQRIMDRPFSGDSEELVGINLRHMNGTIHRGYYWGGPALLPLTPQNAFTIKNVLENTSLPMTLHGKYGKGSVTLCAYHPEMNADNIFEWAELADKDGQEAARIRKLASQYDSRTFPYFLEDAQLSYALKRKRAVSFNPALF